MKVGYLTVEKPGKRLFVGGEEFPLKPGRHSLTSLAELWKDIRRDETVSIRMVAEHAHRTVDGCTFEWVDEPFGDEVVEPKDIPAPEIKERTKKRAPRRRQT